MNQIIKVAACCFILMSPSLFASSTISPSLPLVEQVFTFGFYPTPKELKPYFSNESFKNVYPKFVPADVLIPVGGKRFWQSGVIVTMDKKVFFWSTCADTFIRVISESGDSMFYAISKSVEVK